VVDELLRGLPPLLVYAVVGVLVAAESAFVAGLVLPAATAPNAFSPGTADARSSWVNGWSARGRWCRDWPE